MSNRGFTLLELSVSIGIISLLVSGAVLLVSIEADSSHQSETLAKITMLKRGIVGDPRIVTKESRTDFGYVGDMGSLPATLTDLWTRGAKPLFVYDKSKKTGAGWAGPYVDVGPLEFSDELIRDGWGNTIQYVIQTGTSSATGQEYRAQIFSYGADGASGGGDDITAEIYSPEMSSRVVSYVRDSSGNPMPNVPLKMNHPSNGVLTTVSTTSNSDGSYSFLDIPLGNRSLTIEPKLVYSDGSAVTTGAAFDTVEFVVTSFTCGTIDSATATYDNGAFFAKFTVGNQTVFNETLDLKASGEAVTFSSPVDISWSGCGGGGTSLASIVPVRIQSAFTQIADQQIGASASAGKKFRIRIANFRSLDLLASPSVDMTGVSMTVNFSDGSVATFTPVKQ